MRPLLASLGLFLAACEAEVPPPDAALPSCADVGCPVYARCTADLERCSCTTPDGPVACEIGEP